MSAPTLVPWQPNRNRSFSSGRYARYPIMTISRRGFLAMTAAGAAIRAQDSGQRPIFRVKVDMVVLSFQVTDNKGHYVNGLKPTDFRIFEDAILQQMRKSVGFSPLT